MTKIGDEQELQKALLPLGSGQWGECDADEALALLLGTKPPLRIGQIWCYLDTRGTHRIRVITLTEGVFMSVPLDKRYCTHEIGDTWRFSDGSFRGGWTLEGR